MKVLGWLYVTIVFCLSVNAASAENLRMAYPGTAGFNVPFFLAHDAGLFKKHGINSELVLIANSSPTIQALVAGDIAVVNSTGSAPLNAALRGADLILVASSYNLMPYAMVVSKDVRTAEDLKGKPMAVGNLGGAVEAALLMTLEKLKVNPKESAFIRTGSEAGRIAAVYSGTAAATVIAPPALYKATSMGLRMMVDLGELGLKYPASVITVRRSQLQRDRATIRKIVMGFADALQLYKQDKKLATQVMQKYSRLPDQELVSKTHDYFVRHTSIVPLVDGAAVAAALPPGKAAEKGGPDLFDNSIVQELVKEGYIRQ
jgi:NitT/TauT family transport system substrate-binding protein